MKERFTVRNSSAFLLLTIAHRGDFFLILVKMWIVIAKKKISSSTVVDGLLISKKSGGCCSWHKICPRPCCIFIFSAVGTRCMAVCKTKHYLCTKQFTKTILSQSLPFFEGSRPFHFDWVACKGEKHKKGDDTFTMSTSSDYSDDSSYHSLRSFSFCRNEIDDFSVYGCFLKFKRQNRTLFRFYSLSFTFSFARAEFLFGSVFLSYIWELFYYASFQAFFSSVFFSVSLRLLATFFPVCTRVPSLNNPSLHMVVIPYIG